MIKQLTINALVLIIGLQGGYLIKTYVEYTLGAAPLVTPQGLYKILHEGELDR